MKTVQKNLIYFFKKCCLFRCEERTAALKSPHRVSQMDDPTDAIRRHKSESEEEKMTTPANCIFVLVVMLIVVGILMLGFYFRSVMGTLRGLF